MSSGYGRVESILDQVLEHLDENEYDYTINRGKRSAYLVIRYDDEHDLRIRFSDDFPAMYEHRLGPIVLLPGNDPDLGPYEAPDVAVYPELTISVRDLISVIDGKLHPTALWPKEIYI